MPIYVYECEKGHIFELIQKISDPAPERCKECEAPVRKVLTSAGLIGKVAGSLSEKPPEDVPSRPDKISRLRREDVFIQKAPGFEKRAQKRRESRRS
jgi:putative FmdB family regulatory protein